VNRNFFSQSIDLQFGLINQILLRKLNIFSEPGSKILVIMRQHKKDMREKEIPLTGKMWDRLGKSDHLA